MLVAHLDRFGARRFSGSGGGASRFGVGVRGSGGVLKRVGAAEPAATARGIGAVEPLEPRMLLALVEWDGGAGTDSWHDAMNWSGDAVPTAVDDVVIGESAVVVRVAGAIATARSLTTSVDMLVLASVTVEDRLDLYARMTLGSGETGGHLRFATGSNSIITGTGEIYLDYEGQAFGASVGQYGGALTIESGVTVRGGGGQIRVDSGDLIVRGEVRADVPDRALMVHATSNNASVRVEGLVQSTAGVMQLAGDGVYFDGVGAMKSAGGRMELWGIVQNAGRVFTLAAESGDIYLRYGGFAGGVVRSGGASGFRVDGSLGLNVIGGLDGVHLEAPVWVYNNAELRILNGLTLDGTITLGRGVIGATWGRLNFYQTSPQQALDGNGSVVFDYPSGIYRPDQLFNWMSVGPGVTLEIESGITVRGRGGLVRSENTGTIVNHGTISADEWGLIAITQVGSGQFVNHGRLDATGEGVLELGTYPNFSVTYGEGTRFTANGGRIRVRGLESVSSNPLFFDAEIGTLEVSYSSVTGGAVSSRGGIVAFGNQTTLDGVTINAPVEIIGATRIKTGLTLNAPLAFVYVDRSSPIAGLQFVETPVQFLGGDAVMTFSDSLSSPNDVMVEAGVSLTIAAGIALRGGPGSMRALVGGSIVHLGALEATNPGRTIRLIGDITHHGVMRIAAGATIARTGVWTFQPDSRLDVEIGGTANAQIGRFTGTGAVTMGGAVEVRYVNGYEPPRESSIRFVSSLGTSGAFSSVVTPSLPDPDLKSPVLIDAQGVRLIVTHIADHNNDLVVNELDIFAFLNDWFAGRGDFDGDGTRTVSDIFVFLSAWYRA